jgi:hypothetical protein
MDKDEALNLALEFFETMQRYKGTRSSIFIRFEPTATGNYVDLREFDEKAEPIITAIKQARSAPVQEPVAWLYKDDWGRTKIAFSKETANEWGTKVQPLYTTPPAAPVQEPVVHCEAGPEHCQQCHLEDRSLALAAAVRYVKNNTPKLVSDEICMALASIPAAQRQWAGLTDEDKLHIEIMGGKSDVMLAEMVEAKLKEKNNG